MDKYIRTTLYWPYDWCMLIHGSKGTTVIDIGVEACDNFYGSCNLVNLCKDVDPQRYFQHTIPI